MIETEVLLIFDFLQGNSTDIWGWQTYYIMIYLLLFEVYLFYF